MTEHPLADDVHASKPNLVVIVVVLLAIFILLLVVAFGLMFFCRRRSHDKQCNGPFTLFSFVSYLTFCLTWGTILFVCLYITFLSFTFYLELYMLSVMYLKSILNVLLIIAAVNALLYCSLFDNASKRTKCRFLSRAEGRGENVNGRGFKICQRFIYQIVYYFLYFLKRARFINLSTSAPGSRKTKLGLFMVVLSAAKKPLK